MAYNAGAEFQDSFEEDILGLTEIAKEERQLVEPIWEVSYMIYCRGQGIAPQGV